MIKAYFPMYVTETQKCLLSVTQQLGPTRWLGHLWFSLWAFLHLPRPPTSLRISDKQLDAQAEAPILWPPDVKSQLTGKDPDAGKD